MAPTASATGTSSPAAAAAAAAAASAAGTSSPAAAAAAAAAAALQLGDDPTRAARRYASFFQQHTNNGPIRSFADKWALLQAACAHENALRAWFAKPTSDPLHARATQEPHLNLIPVYTNLDQDRNTPPSIFLKQKLFPEERACPKVMPLSTSMRKPDNFPTVVSRNTFQRNFDIFSEGMLRFIDWTNCFVAGGAVLACLITHDSSSQKQALLPTRDPSEEDPRRSVFHSGPYRSADIDIFIHSLDEEAAKRKLVELARNIQDAIAYPMVVFRTKNTVTLVSQYPYKHVQVVLRRYSSPAEILLGFDVDCCSVGYDGTQVWCTPRAHNAISSQYNTVDVSRRSPSYEVRLAKYAERGFEVLVPSLRRDNIDPQIFEQRFTKIQGLARLLLLEKFRDPAERQRFKYLQRLKTGRPQDEQNSFWALLSRELKPERQANAAVRPGYRKAKSHFVGGGQGLGSMMKPGESDYSTVFLPWGEGWTAQKIQHFMFRKDLCLNSSWFNPKQAYHTHPCFSGTMEHVLGDCCPNCPALPASIAEQWSEMPFVRGKLAFIEDNPGRQQIGSFHPITEGEWTEGALLSEDTSEVFQAAIARDVPAMLEALENATNRTVAPSNVVGGVQMSSNSAEVCDGEMIDLPSPTLSVDMHDACGRTLLHVAAFLDAPEVAYAVLEKGAKLTERLTDGRTALHVAVTYNRVEIVRHILEELQKRKLKRAQEENQSSRGADVNADRESDTEDGGADQAEDELAVVESIHYDTKMTALHYALMMGHTEIVKLLLCLGEASATHALKYKIGETAHLQSFSTVEMAMLHPETAVEHVRLLMNAGVRVSQRNYALMNVLHCALLHVNRLRIYDCRVGGDDEDEDGGVAQARQVVQLLLEGSDARHVRKAINALGFDVPSCAWRSPVALACQLGDDVSVALLIKHGATPRTLPIHIEELIKRVNKIDKAKRDKYVFPSFHAASLERNVVQPLILAIRSGSVKAVNVISEARGGLADDILDENEKPDHRRFGGRRKVAAKSRYRYRFGKKQKAGWFDLGKHVSSVVSFVFTVFSWILVQLQRYSAADSEASDAVTQLFDQAHDSLARSYCVAVKTRRAFDGESGDDGSKESDKDDDDDDWLFDDSDSDDGEDQSEHNDEDGAYAKKVRDRDALLLSGRIVKTYEELRFLMRMPKAFSPSVRVWSDYRAGISASYQRGIEFPQKIVRASRGENMCSTISVASGSKKQRLQLHWEKAFLQYRIDADNVLQIASMARLIGRQFGPAPILNRFWAPTALRETTTRLGIFGPVNAAISMVVLACFFASVPNRSNFVSLVLYFTLSCVLIFSGFVRDAIAQVLFRKLSDPSTVTLILTMCGVAECFLVDCLMGGAWFTGGEHGDEVIHDNISLPNNEVSSGAASGIEMLLESSWLWHMPLGTQFFGFISWFWATVWAISWFFLTSIPSLVFSRTCWWILLCVFMVLRARASWRLVFTRLLLVRVDRAAKWFAKARQVLANMYKKLRPRKRAIRIFSRLICALCAKTKEVERARLRKSDYTYATLGGKSLPESHFELYDSLFAASFSGDVETINRLTATQQEVTVKRKEGDLSRVDVQAQHTEMVHVLVCARNESLLTPLTLAVLGGHAAAARRIVEIACIQFTPPPPKTVDDGGAKDGTLPRAMNNMDLLRGMHIHPRDYLDADGNAQCAASGDNADYSMSESSGDDADYDARDEKKNERKNDRAAVSARRLNVISSDSPSSLLSHKFMLPASRFPLFGCVGFAVNDTPLHACDKKGLLAVMRSFSKDGFGANDDSFVCDFGRHVALSVEEEMRVKKECYRDTVKLKAKNEKSVVDLCSKDGGAYVISANAIGLAAALARSECLDALLDAISSMPSNKIDLSAKRSAIGAVVASQLVNKSVVTEIFSRDNYGSYMSALMWAAVGGCVPVILSLLRWACGGANVTARLAHEAARLNRDKRPEDLSCHGNEPLPLPPGMAPASGDGAEAEGQAASAGSLSRDADEYMGILFGSDRGSALRRAAWARDFLPTKLDGAFAVDISFLHIAAFYGQLPVLRLAFDGRAGDEIRHFVSTTDFWKRTREAAAFFQSTLEIGEGGIVSSVPRDEGKCRAMLDDKVHEFLTESMCGPVVVDAAGRNVLHYAVWGNQPCVIASFVEWFSTAHPEVSKEKAKLPVIDMDSSDVLEEKFGNAEESADSDDAEEKSIETPTSSFVNAQMYRVGWTPLHLAVLMRHPLCVAALLRLPNAVVNPLRTDKIRGWTALHYAIHSGATLCAQVIVNMVPRHALTGVLNAPSVRQRVTPMHLVCKVRSPSDVTNSFLLPAHDERDAVLMKDGIGSVQAAPFELSSSAARVERWAEMPQRAMKRVLADNPTEGLLREKVGRKVLSDALEESCFRLQGRTVHLVASATDVTCVDALGNSLLHFAAMSRSLVTMKRVVSLVARTVSLDRNVRNEGRGGGGGVAMEAHRGDRGDESPISILCGENAMGQTALDVCTYLFASERSFLVANSFRSPDVQTAAVADARGRRHPLMDGTLPVAIRMGMQPSTVLVSREIHAQLQCCLALFDRVKVGFKVVSGDHHGTRRFLASLEMMKNGVDILPEYTEEELDERDDAFFNRSYNDNAGDGCDSDVDDDGVVDDGGRPVGGEEKRELLQKSIRALQLRLPKLWMQPFVPWKGGSMLVMNRKVEK